MSSDLAFCNKKVKLNQPRLIDFSKLCSRDEVRIVIYNAQHKFATDSNYSGICKTQHPIFGSRVYINNELFTESTYGMPFIRFAKGSKPKIIWDNQTLFTTNIHYHGLNTDGSIDGVTMEDVFGLNTSLGRVATFQFPEITNNQCLLFFHSHNMFVSIELIISGILGLMEIVDEPTKWLTKEFKYGDNQLLLAPVDMDFTDEGVQTQVNITKGGNRSCFTVVNGTSCVDWYSSSSVPFVDQLYHETTKNLVKVDMVNGTANWRVYSIGVCDLEGNIKSFHQVQVDGGLVNPVKLTMLMVPVAGRVSIIVDLNKFKDQVAYLFFYNYDLTEVFGSQPTPNDTTLTGTIPDLKISNPTPYPTPIPDPDHLNQQGGQSALDYPEVPLIPQVQEVLENGSIIPPKRFNIKPFLRINLRGKSELKLSKTIRRIRKTVFGYENYKSLRSSLKDLCFEYDGKIDYIKLLNPNYYYNLPKVSPDVPTRNILLFSEIATNAFPTNPHGTTEYVLGAARIMTDLWNSDELNLEWALQQYNLSPNNFKPPVLPTSKFRIFKTDDRYSNTAAISNDTLKVQIFGEPISYGVFDQEPLTEATIVFPPTPTCKLMNIQEWIDLVNETFKKTKVRIENKRFRLSSILACDWSFFPYALDLESNKTVYVKSGVIKTINGSGYWIRLLGRWPLLQFFGKPMTGSSAVPFLDVMHHRRQNVMGKHEKMLKSRPQVNSNSTGICSPEVFKNPDLFIRCDEPAIYGTYDAMIQHLFPFYATSKGDVQLPIACMRRDAELIICPNFTYIGLWDGYMNDNLNVFSVRLHGNETWIYTNGDDQDAHSLHFHLTQGFASPQSNNSSSGLLSCRRDYDPLTYSRDIYQIGPQQAVAFNLTWPFYSSFDTTKSPPIKCVGGVIHCHLLVHNDLNSMMIQYFVDHPEEKKCDK